MGNHDKTELSEIEKAEQLIRERDEENFTEFVRRYNDLCDELGYDLYNPPIQQPQIQVRKRVNA